MDKTEHIKNNKIEKINLKNINSFKFFFLYFAIKMFLKFNEKILVIKIVNAPMIATSVALSKLPLSTNKNNIKVEKELLTILFIVNFKIKLFNKG